MDKQINHDKKVQVGNDQEQKRRNESKTRTHRMSKLPDDGDPCAPNNLLTPEQKKTTN